MIYSLKLEINKKKLSEFYRCVGNNARLVFGSRIMPAKTSWVSHPCQD